MIELDKFETWPNKIIDLIGKNSYTIKKEQDIEYEHRDLRWFPSIAPRTDCYNDTKSKIESIILNHQVKAYHCTKIQSWEELRKNGLIILKHSTIKSIVTEAIKKVKCDPEFISQVSNAYDDFEKKGSYKYRENMIWFVLNNHLIYEDGCEDFFIYFGGEVTRRALYRLKLDVLRSIGIPTIVECILDVNKAEPFQVSNIANEIIKYGISKFVLNTEYKLKCEMCIVENVPHNKIIDILERKF